MRDHAGRDVDAGGEPPLHDRPARTLRLDNGRIGRIDEDCALHVALSLGGAPTAVLARANTARADECQAHIRADRLRGEPQSRGRTGAPAARQTLWRFTA